VGCLVMELLTAAVPFAHMGSKWLVLRYVGGLQPDDTPNLGPKKFHPDATSFMHACLRPVPSHRRTADGLLQMKFIHQGSMAATRKTGRLGRGMSMASLSWTAQTQPEDCQSDGDDSTSGWGIDEQRPSIPGLPSEAATYPEGRVGHGDTPATKMPAKKVSKKPAAKKPVAKKPAGVKKAAKTKKPAAAKKAAKWQTPSAAQLRDP